MRNLPQVYIPAGKGRLPELYLRDANARRLISRLKWFISTCIVGTAGLCIIGVAMYASTDIEDGSGLVGSLRSATIAALKPKATGNLIEEKIALPGEKTDKIKTTTKGLTTKYIIHDSFVERRNSREFVTVKPYIRIAATLSTVKLDNSDAIPAFNPFDLYVDNKSSRSRAATGEPNDKAAHNQFLTSRLLDIAGGFLPEEDQQELADDEVERFIAETDAVYAESAAQLRPGILPGEDGSAQANGAGAEAGDKPAKLAYTTILEKKPDEDDDSAEDNELQSIIVKPGDTLIGILKTAGAEAWQAQAIGEAYAAVPGGFKLRTGQEVRLKLAPAATDPSLKEPVKISIFSGVKSEGTAVRTDDGEYKITDDHIKIAAAQDEDGDASSRATLYNSIYAAALAQGLEPEDIVTVLRVLSYDVDYKQKVRPGDGFELFFDVKADEEGGDMPGELLHVSMNIGNEAIKYYRFRTPDGEVDFYNPKGSNSRKFLMLSPVKSGRFTSGFGFRRHPLLGIKKMHTGVDWAAPTGTPIMAAGNGTVELAGRHGGNGNYIRIRHGNGYKTAYSHMSRFAPGIKKGVKVRQGEIIGYVGSTGLSTGPHLHYEVLINNRFTNPQKIHVPRSRQLNGRLLTEFRKEIVRLDELMHRAPVKTRIAAADD
ncbi:MAG: peptidoglycan DD-metalloendopeptidase family protein [Rhodomicrobium sp.]|nr:peptidoglycan DD-metalloendopeptidase family protein [Rhodomicrobium sp.]